MLPQHQLPVGVVVPGIDMKLIAFKGCRVAGAVDRSLQARFTVINDSTSLARKFQIRHSRGGSPQLFF
jgi:hypothetical protein